ncbi:Odorant receptor 86, partial [Halyomorpha halys]
MEPPRYVDQYGELFKWQRRCGFSTPWLEKPYFYFRFLDLAYDTITISMVLYILLDYSYTMLTTSLSFQ